MNGHLFQHITQRLLPVAFVLFNSLAIAGEHVTVQDPGEQLTDFNATITNNKIALYWETGSENNFSHFVVERSHDGMEFKDAALVFAGENTAAPQKYFFADAVNTHQKGVYYYRLRMVQANGKHTHSVVRLIKTGEKANIAQMGRHPNPVAKGLRISMLPCHG